MMNKLVLIGINSLRGFLTPLFNFSIAIVGIKLFGKESWGQVIDILLWIYFILIIANWGNRSYLVREYSRIPSKIHPIYFKSFYSRSPLLLLSLIFFFFLQIDTALLCIILSVMLYINSSFDSLIIHHQKFGLQLISDLVGFSTTLLILYIKSIFNLNIILIAFIISAFLKNIILIYYLNPFRNISFSRLSILELKKHFSFFLIAFLGWLSTKIDMYIVSIKLNNVDVSEYQIISNSFIMINAGFAFLITPFSKHIYRLSISKINNIKRKLNLIALPYLIMCTFLIWLVMEKILQLNININYYYLSSVKALFPLFFIIDIMILNKLNLEKKISYIIVLGLLVNIICMLFLIEKFQIIGVIVSTIVSKLFLLFIYKWHTRNLT